MRFLAIVILFLASAINAQSLEYKTHTAINTISQDTYSFPIFSSATNAAIADSINSDLVSDFLWGDFHKGPDSLFVNVWPTEQQPHMARLYLYGFTIVQNSNGILSIGFDAEGCGAYCEEFTRHYTYDLRDGKRILLDSLFTKAGIKHLADTLIKGKITRITTELRSLQQTLKTLKKKKRPDPEQLEFTTASIDLFTECLEYTKANKNDLVNYINDEDYFLTPTEIGISIGRCSVHANRALDGIGNFKFLFKMKDWHPYLSAYGKSLLGAQ